MANNKKWKLNMTLKFIQCYKQHECLWNFSSPGYKNRQKRDAAYIAIANEMNIDDFGVQEVKNKIKNLRSTYSQEMKKIENSKKPGTGRKRVYFSNIKWLKEMEEIFMNDVNRKSSCEEKELNEIKSESAEEEEQEMEEDVDSQCLISTAQVDIRYSMPSTSADTDNSNNVSTTPRPKKRSKEIVKAINDLKTLHDKINIEEATPFDVFGKSVAMQLKILSVENALLAQQKIQSILSEIGITDYREKTENMSNYS